MIFNEEQKRFIVEMEDTYTLRLLGLKFNCTPQEIYDCYSEIVDSGEHWKYYKKKYTRIVSKLPQARRSIMGYSMRGSVYYSMPFEIMKELAIKINFKRKKELEKARKRCVGRSKNGNNDFE